MNSTTSQSRIDGKAVPHELGNASASRPHAPPRINPFYLKFFRWYSRRYIRRHFHAVRVARSGNPPTPRNTPLIVIMNHPSWWDPLIGLLLAETYFPDRRVYAPIEARQLQRYGILGRLGFFGVERESAAGTRSFLRAGDSILSIPQSVLWLTPQGRFVDSRQTNFELERGAAMLLRRHPEVEVLPLALEYVFWNDRLPEVLVRFGDLLTVKDLGHASADLDSINATLTHKLARVQIQLSEDSLSRDAQRFWTFAHGRSGVGGFYDWQRRCRAWWLGRSFAAEHGGTDA